MLRIYHKALVYELNCLNYNIDTEMNIVVKYKDSQGKIHNLESIRIDIFIHELNIILEGKFITERGRINCSLRENNGFYRWLGIQFVVKEK